ncbi:MAG: xylulokinase [Anaerolineae bacterium]|nr:xylulokinase [Anaerolineae bacterium]
MPYYLGIDSSTTGVKALLIDENGDVAGTATTELSLATPKPLWSEQDPADWWAGAVSSIKQVLQNTHISGDQIKAIGLTGQMHGLTLLDEAGEVLRPAILWNDQRTGPQCDEIRARLGKQRLVEVTGNDALTGFTAPKILWVREHEPDIYDEIDQILLPKDYIRYRLTDDYATDKAGAAGTLLLNVKSRNWSVEVLDALEIPAGWLPPTYEGTEVTGNVSDEAALATGLEPGTPVVAGGGDQAAQAVGVGAVQPGVIALTLGTSGVVFASAAEPFIEPEGRLHAFCHAVPGRWHMMGVMLSAAGSLRWYRDTLAPGIDFDTLLAPTSDISPGSEGLLFLPYLTGERTPHPDPLARGAFAGITVRHTQVHFTRAVLEGVAFGLRDGFELMKNAGLTDIKQVRVSGGGAKSPIWRQILADVLNVELVTVNTSEGAAYGAALLAAVGARVWPDVDTATQACIQLTGSTRPQAETVAVYDQFYAQYRQLYPALKDISHNLGQLS